MLINRFKNYPFIVNRPQNRKPSPKDAQIFRGVIIKARTGGDQSGVPNKKPLTENPEKVIAAFEEMRVNTVRIQVNDVMNVDKKRNGKIVNSGARSANELVAGGWKGKIILETKKHELHADTKRSGSGLTRAEEWATQVSDTYNKLSNEAKKQFAGFSFGETNPNNMDWNKHSSGIAKALISLAYLMPKGAMNGKHIIVGGASYNGAYADFSKDDHERILSAASVLGKNIKISYGYKTFHTNKGKPKLTPRDRRSVKTWKSFLRNDAGLANLEKLQENFRQDQDPSNDFKVIYFGDAGDKADIGDKGNAIRQIFKEYGWTNLMTEIVLLDPKAEVSARNLFQASGASDKASQKRWKRFANN